MNSEKKKFFNFNCFLLILLIVNIGNVLGVVVNEEINEEPTELRPYYVKSVIDAYDEGFLIIGQRASGQIEGTGIIKISDKGNLVWEISRTEGLLCCSDVFSIQKLRVGYVLFTNQGIMRIDEFGNEIWTDINFNREIVDGVITKDYEIVLLEKYYDVQGSYFWLRKFDSNGYEIWDSPLNFEFEDPNLTLNPYKLITLEDNDLMFYGQFFNTSETLDPNNHEGLNNFIFKTDEYGNTRWKKYYFNINRFSTDLILTSDNDLIMVGEYGDPYSYSNSFITKFDLDGEIIWDLQYLNSSLYSVLETKDNQYIAVGSKFDDIELIGTISYYEQDGRVVSTEEFLNFVPIDLAESYSGGIMIIGGQESALNYPGYYLLYDHSYEKPPEDESNYLIIGIIVFFFTLIVIGMRIRSKYNLAKSTIINLNWNQKKIIKEIFQSQTSLYYVLLGQSKFNDKEVEKGIISAAPKQLYDFKYLLHPVRLSIMKVLFENIRLTSSEVKEILGLSWNDYTNNVPTMVKKGFIEVRDVFLDATKKQVLSITTYGIQEFNTLMDLLHIFMDNTIDYSSYILQAQKMLDEPERDTYPKLDRE